MVFGYVLTEKIMALTNKMNTKHQFNLEQDFFLFKTINYNSLILHNALLTQKHILRQIAGGLGGFIIIWLYLIQGAPGVKKGLKLSDAILA